tara:strand:+ start:15 stop:512 length:498 start_codon:yes stop_codon:yes gene_type:complete
MKKEIFPITLILILALSRLIPHPPNFTPIIAVAILSGYFFKNLYLSFLVLITSMIVADFFIGFYDNMLVTYMTLIFISFTFYKVGSRLNYKNLFLFSLFGSLIFFIITNFGVWALGSLYEKNLKGLIECYILAIPFFGNTFLSTLVFAYPSIFIHKKVASLSIAR